MAVTNTPIFPQALNTGIVQILAADTQTYKTLFTAGVNGSKVEAIFMSSNDTSARDVTLNITRSASNFQISQINIPLTAGFLNSAPSVNIMGNSQVVGLPRDPNGNPYIYLKSGDTLTINAPVTLTAAKSITAIAMGGDF